MVGDHIGFATTDPGEKIGAVTDNKDGTYTATITSSTTIGTATITATDSSVTPTVSGQATLTQGIGPAGAVTVSLTPAAILANGTAQATATAHVSDAQGHAVVGDHVGFASTDPGEKIGAVTDNKDGTYTATITSSTTIGTATITATDSSVTPTASGQATLTQTQVGAPLSAPVNMRPPSISGTPTVGRTLTATSGTWSGTAPIGYAYQWQRCGAACAAIAGARTSTYRVTSTDRGSRLRVLVTATNANGSAQAVSSQVGPVASALRGNLATNLAQGEEAPVDAPRSDRSCGADRNPAQSRRVFESGQHAGPQPPPDQLVPDRPAVPGHACPRQDGHRDAAPGADHGDPDPRGPRVAGGRR